MIDPRTQEMKDQANKLSYEVIGAAMEVHKHLGPGLLESAYQACLERELELRAIPFGRQVPLCLEYKGLRVESAYKIDLVIDDLVVIELKSVDALDTIHEAQLSTYLRFSNRWLGLLINFNTVVLKNGIKRWVN
jgi:GxxExxY protein